MAGNVFLQSLELIHAIVWIVSVIKSVVWYQMFFKVFFHFEACGGHIIALLLLLVFPPMSQPTIVDAALHDSRYLDCLD